ncbi:hypothetical protein BRADI_1g28522v3 [Brachypodium distachyon]|uniref:Uncharacterized protein n=1 Tax=Brachypodium distachyon TaxID=15368 RepID=A0A2K2DLN2_BRADI|nr:hypothetical protein BRADI_1g28522v3 [Brachypodium distachyon]
MLLAACRRRCKCRPGRRLLQLLLRRLCCSPPPLALVAGASSRVDRAESQPEPSRQKRLGMASGRAGLGSRVACSDRTGPASTLRSVVPSMEARLGKHHRVNRRRRGSP